MSTTFSVITLWALLFCSMTHYDITIGNDVARDVHCDIITGHDVVIGTYHDVTMQTDVARMLIYYAVLWPVLNGISITRSQWRFRLEHYILWESSSGHYFFVP